MPPPRPARSAARSSSGDYEVSVGSEAAVPREIKPAKLTVGAARKSSSDELQLP